MGKIGEQANLCAKIKTIHMFELPLFPLNTVLFPGAPIHLHIFEARYQQMIGLCIEERRPFGVVLIRSGKEANAPLATPYRVGCTANIIQVQRLEQGRFNVVAIGQERFRILTLDADTQPYLIGQVELYPIRVTDPKELEQQAARLRHYFKKFVAAVIEVSGNAVDIGDLPEDALGLAYIAATVLQIGVHQKQALLEQTDAAMLFNQLLHLYRREQALLKAMILHGEQQDDAPYSLN
jgi:Lon protease-like protein